MREQRAMMLPKKIDYVVVGNDDDVGQFKLPTKEHVK